MSDELRCKVCGADRFGGERCNAMTHACASARDAEVKDIVHWLRTHYRLNANAQETADALERFDHRTAGPVDPAYDALCRGIPKPDP